MIVHVYKPGNDFDIWVRTLIDTYIYTGSIILCSHEL